MDGTRFDALAKSLARGLTRRRVLASIGAVIAGSAAASASAATGRPKGALCRKHGECASGVCGPKDATGRQRCQAATGDACAVDQDCGGGPCLEGTCCAGADLCFDSCCDPNRSPTETCCPAFNSSGCCECFTRSDPGNERLECCSPEKLCKSLTNSPAGDQCCHEDEVCVNGDCCWTGKACENQCCQTKCCNGECCASGEECAVASGGTVASCQAVRSCTADSDCNTAAGERCATNPKVCCPPERTIAFQIATDEGPMTIRVCCRWGTLQSLQTSQPECCPEPDRCSTSRGTFGRF